MKRKLKSWVLLLLIKVSPLILTLSNICWKCLPPLLKGGPIFHRLHSYYRQLIPIYSELAAPLTDLTGSKATFVWTDETAQSFEEVKRAIAEKVVLKLPDPKKPYRLYTDASKVALGSVLVQEEGGVERPVAYYSKKFSKTQRKWATNEKEAFAIIASLQKFRHYLVLTLLCTLTIGG